LTLIQGEISDLINHKLDEWKLTKAERSVTWLVIKGFSFKKISEIREVSEKTIHQQTSSIYKKSGSKNRHELMSDFLDYFINSEE
jgi:DNA-binding CsgD family transcriptional regulator